MKLTLPTMFLALTLSACALPSPGANQPAITPTALPEIAAPNQVIADGVVLPVRSVELNFAVGGTVASTPVEVGATVNANAPLAALDGRDLELALAQSRANLAQAQATYDKLAAGATPQEIAAQEALLAQANANVQRARQGTSTAADVAAARAQQRQAEANLAALRTPSAGDLSAAQARAEQARVAVQATRDSASATKTRAELALGRAADALTQAQASYATAKENWTYVQETGADPTRPTTTDANGRTVKNKVNDVQERQYYEAFVQAEAALRAAEKAVSDAQVAFDGARQAEVAAVQSAETTLADAQSQLAALQNPDPNRVAALQAQVDQARASVQRAQQGGTQADVDAAAAQVAQQQANLERVTVPPRAVDLAEAKARIAAAQVAIQLAERDLEQAVLRAPFTGTVATRTLEIGQRVNVGAANTPAVVLADTTVWKVTTDNLNERDVVRFALGAPAQLTFDALPDVTLPGTVSAIDPRGVDRFGEMTYTVTVTPNTWDARLRWNMSAVVTIPVGP